MTELGVAGYLVKQTSAVVLAEAIREVHKGNTFYSPSVSSRFTISSRRRRTERGDD